MRTYVAVIGLLSAAVAFVFLFIPLSVVATSWPGEHSVTCGSALSAETTLPRIEGVLSECGDALSDRRAWVLPLLIVGLVVAVGAGISAAQANRREPGTTADAATT